MRYRLGLTLGSNTIGWAALRLGDDGDPDGLVDLGVRVYPDGRTPKDGASLAAARRGPRSARRNRDRYLRRRQNLLNALTRVGLMPADETARRIVAAVDPYKLRRDALYRRLTPHELGRVLFHLNQSRGFASNRRLDRNSDEAGPIRTAADTTLDELRRGGHLTYGDWLADRHAKREGVRARLTGSGRTASYPFYPTRQLIEAEFDAIWSAQAAWDNTLTPETGAELRRIIFHQRPLRPAIVGKCWLEPQQLRAPSALPSTQRMRIAQTVAHLRISQYGMPERALTDRERALVLQPLYRGTDQRLDRIRRALKLPADAEFNMRDEKLAGCAVAARLGAKSVFGAVWHERNLAAQDAAVRVLLDADSDEEATAALIAMGLPAEGAARAARVCLPDGYASLSSRAIGRILPHLEAGLVYSSAVRAAGYDSHSDKSTGEVLPRLPYYGQVLAERVGVGDPEATTPEKRWGRAPNPTVHVALNQLRHVVNAVIDRHGAPAEIVVQTLREVARSQRQRQEYEREQRQHRTANDRRRAMLVEMNERPSGWNVMRLRLWQEQADDPMFRVCPYSGTVITARMALSDEAIVEDRILPFSLVLDDSPANRILATRDASRAKGARTPFAAFGHTEEWEQIVARAALLPASKRWRFQSDALEKFSKNNDYLARHLADSATIARWTAMYLDVLAPGRVWSVPGRLAGLLRHALGLDGRAVIDNGPAREDRHDHRRHAIAGVVVALTDRSLLQRIALAARRAEDLERRLLDDVEPPWPNFVADVAARVRALIVSHKPDTGWQGALHNDTAYGLIRSMQPDGPNVVLRRPLAALADWSPDDARAGIRDPLLAARVASTLTLPEPARTAALATLTQAGVLVRRVRTVEKIAGIQPIADRRTGRVYKAVKRDSNHRAEVWRMPDGSDVLRIVTTFAAASQAESIRLGRKVPDPRPHPAARLLLRLHKADLIAISSGADRRILRLVKMSGQHLVFADHVEAGNLRAREADESDGFSYFHASAAKLRREGARKLRVLPGRVYDPGPIS